MLRECEISISRIRISIGSFLNNFAVTKVQFAILYSCWLFIHKIAEISLAFWITRCICWFVWNFGSPHCGCCQEFPLGHILTLIQQQFLVIVIFKNFIMILSGFVDLGLFYFILDFLRLMFYQKIIYVKKTLSL